VSDSVSVLLGNGFGFFSAARSFSTPSGSGPHSVVVDDFNRDDKPDLATANRFSNDVSIFLNSSP